MSLSLERLECLVVDDNAHMRIMIREILHAFGIRKVTECSDGTEALSELRHKPIDFVITDWAMDPLDGIDFTRLTRTAKDSPNPFVPVIMLTGHTERHRILEARDAGVTEFLAKPVTANGVYARIKSLIDNQRQFVRVGNYFGPCRRRKIEDFAGLGKRERDVDQGSTEEGSIDEDPAREDWVKNDDDTTDAQDSGMQEAADAVGKLQS